MKVLIGCEESQTVCKAFREQAMRGTMGIKLFNMKTAILIPDRGDRPMFRKHCEYLIEKQTVQPDEICFMDYEPESNDIDITQRYRRGFEQLKDKADVILFMENDDWYKYNYIERMMEEWNKAGRPDLLGTSYTHYYHIKLKRWFTMNHPERSSAMNTLIRTDIDIDWCADTEPYTDTYLWFIAKNKRTGMPLTKKTFAPTKPISIGIKHGVGKTGGNCHSNRLHRFINDGREWIKEIVEPKSVEFYDELARKLK